MRLPAHLLTQLRVGVGVGAVLLAGCDLLADDDAKAGVQPETIAAAGVSTDEAEVPEAAPKSGGLASKVAQAIETAKPEPLLDLPEAPSRAPDREIDEGPPTSPRAAAEDVTAFVPFGESSASPPTRIRPRKPRPTTTESPLALAPDEPCDPAVSPVLGSGPIAVDPCPACGRG